MTLTYETRNLAAIAKLADHTKAAALHWYDFCRQNNINILITETIRSEAQQKADVAKGVSQTMKSYHLTGQAIDFVPVVAGGGINYNLYSNADIQKAIAYAKSLGFEWGGDWKGFIDKPHLQFNFNGYGTDTFGKWTEPKPAAQAVTSLPPKTPGMTRLVKLIDTTEPTLIKTLKSQGYIPFDSSVKSVEALPVKTPGMTRLAKLIDTTDPNLIKTLKSQGYKILSNP